MLWKTPTNRNTYWGCIKSRINDACRLFECAFRDGVSEQLFERLSELRRVPGWDVDHGVNTHRGGLNKSVVQIYHNKAKETQDAALVVEDSLKLLGFRFILWKRDVIGGELKSNVYAEVFDKELEKQVADQAEAVAQKQAEAMKTRLDLVKVYADNPGTKLEFW